MTRRRERTDWVRPPLPPELLARIETLWAAGYSSGMIAYDVKETRNKVIGIIKRYNFAAPTVKLAKRSHPSIYDTETRKASPRRKPQASPVVPNRNRDEPVAAPHVVQHRDRVRITVLKASEPTKDELRRQFQEALANTAKLPKPILTSEGY